MRIVLTLVLCFAFSAIYSQEKSNLKQGAQYFDNQEYKKALKCFKKELKENYSVEAEFAVGLTYAVMEQWTDAKPYFYHIIYKKGEIRERQPSLVNLGNCYRELGEMDSAHFYYDMSIDEYPDEANGYFNKASANFTESKFEESKYNYTEAIKLVPDNWWYYRRRLDACFASEDFEGALKDLIKVRELNPEAGIEFNLAYCYSMLERYEEADSIFKLIYDEESAWFLNNYGMNKFHMGEVEEGKKLINRSIKLDSQNSYAYRNLALIAIDEDEEAKICEYLSQAQMLGFERNYGPEVNDLLEEHCK